MLCAANEKTQLFEQPLELALWRQCETSIACGSGQHCCEIGGGESRCYPDSTACP